MKTLWPALIAICVSILIVLLVVLMAMRHAHARDVDGRYAQSPLKGWFDGLKSGKGPCCSDADGSAISDADWEISKDGKHYRVRIPDKATPGDPMVWSTFQTKPSSTNRTVQARPWCGRSTGMAG